MRPCVPLAAVIVPLCLSSNPVAAESTGRQPFTVRLWASESVGVAHTSSFPPTEAAPPAEIAWSSELALQVLSRQLLSMLHPAHV